jgi:hypothetical protein
LNGTVRRLLGLTLLLAPGVYADTIVGLSFSSLTNAPSNTTYRIHTNGSGGSLGGDGTWNNQATNLVSNDTIGNAVFLGVSSAILDLNFLAGASGVTSNPGAPGGVTFTASTAAVGTITITSGANTVTFNSNSVTGYDLLANFGTQIAAGNSVTITYTLGDTFGVTRSPSPSGINTTYTLTDLRSLGGTQSLTLIYPTEVPEPAAFVLIGCGLAALGFARWRKRR